MDADPRRLGKGRQLSAALAASVTLGAASAHAAIVVQDWTASDGSKVELFYDDALAPYFMSTDGLGNPYRANFSPSTSVDVTESDGTTYTFDNLIISALQNAGSINYTFSADRGTASFQAYYNTTAANDLNKLPPGGFPINPGTTFDTTYSLFMPDAGVSTTVALTGNGSAGAVPEPASWALMILGFGSLGAVARRRRDLTACSAPRAAA